jgi:hypothetical protein
MSIQRASIRLWLRVNELRGKLGDEVNYVAR